MWKKGNFPPLLVVNANGTATMERSSLVAQTVKHLVTLRETQVWSLNLEDTLQKEMATHFSTFAWKIPWTENVVGYSLRGRKESDSTEWLHFHFHYGKLWKVLKKLKMQLPCDSAILLLGMYLDIYLILFTHKEEENSATCNNEDVTRGYCVEWNKSGKDK